MTIMKIISKVSHKDLRTDERTFCKFDSVRIIGALNELPIELV